MAERSSLNQLIQLGVEVTKGTTAVATKRLQSISIEPSITAEKDDFRPIGQKYASLSTMGKEWSTAAIGGRNTFTEIVYMLASVINTPTTNTVTGVTTHTFTSSSTADDNPKTFTVEHGSSVRADRFSYGLVTELGMSFNRSTCEVTGSMIGKALEDGITMTPSGVTTVPLVPVLPTQVSVYLDPSAATLGATKLTRVISADFNIGGRFGPVWVLDAAQASFVNHIETQPDLSANLTLQADTAGMALLGNLRDGATKFLRIEAVGPNIPGGTPTTPYKLTIDLAGKINNTGSFSDQDGIYAIQFSMIGVHDTTWGKALNVVVLNDVTSL